MGELGPIIAISLALSTDDPGKAAVILIAFGAIALVTGWLATRPARPRTVELIARTLNSSAQLGVRLCVLACVLLVWAAEALGLDILLGAFAAGMVARLFLVAHSAEPNVEPAHAGDHRHTVQQRLESLGFGFFTSLFFVISGVRFDLAALGHPSALAKVPLFLALVLVAPKRDVLAFGLLQSAALPLVVVIITLGVATGRMRPDNAAAMVGAGLVSVVVLPIVALAVRDKASTSAAESAAHH